MVLFERTSFVENQLHQPIEPRKEETDSDQHNQVVAIFGDVNVTDLDEINLVQRVPVAGVLAVILDDHQHVLAQRQNEIVGKCGGVEERALVGFAVFLDAEALEELEVEDEVMDAHDHVH